MFTINITLHNININTYNNKKLRAEKFYTTKKIKKKTNYALGISFMKRRSQMLIKILYSDIQMIASCCALQLIR